MINRPRVLVDLSHALRERAGIPFVARHLTWNFSRTPGIQTAVLLASIHHGSKADLYRQAKPAREALVQDALFLSDALTAQSSGSFEPLRWTRLYCKIMTGSAFPLIPLEAKLLDDVIWEHYFAPTLPASARETLRCLRFFRTPLTRREATTSGTWGVPRVRLDTRGHDFVIFQNPTMVRVSRGTVKLVRCHDLVPLFRFDTQPVDSPQISAYNRALKACAQDSYFVCISDSTRRELLAFDPSLEKRCVVIPNSLAAPVAHVGGGAASGKGGCFLSVGTIEPRKNYRRMLDGFRLYRRRTADPRPLILVANPGWHSENETREIEMAVRKGWLTWLRGVSPEQLAEIYAKAHALVSTSVHEGFGYPPLEAAAQGTPSVLSDLPVYRGHFGDAAEYFDPYDPGALAGALARMTDERRAALAALMPATAARFHADVELEAWQRLFVQLGEK